MNTITIRPAQIKDIPQIVNLYSGWQEFKNILPDQLIAPESEKNISPYISGVNLDRTYIVADINHGNLVGVCYLDLTFVSLQVIRIGDFIVASQYRNQGIGTQTLSYIKNYCKANNITKLWLWTQEELVDTIRFYVKNGFNLEGKQKSQFIGKDALLLGLIM